MTQLLVDSFTEAADTALHSHASDSAHAYIRTGQLTDALVVSEADDFLIVANAALTLYRVDDAAANFPATGRIRARINHVHNGGERSPAIVFLCTRLGAANSCFGVRFDQNNNIELRRYTDVENDGSVETLLDQAYTGTFSGIYHLQIEPTFIAGSPDSVDIRVRAWTDDFVGSNLVFDQTVNNTNLLSGTIGIAALNAPASATNWLDDLEFDDLQAPAANAGLRIPAKQAGGANYPDTADVTVVVYDVVGGTELLETTGAIVSGVVEIDSDLVGSVDDEVFVIGHKDGATRADDIGLNGYVSVVDLNTADESV